MMYFHKYYLSLLLPMTRLKSQDWTTEAAGSTIAQAVRGTCRSCSVDLQEFSELRSWGPRKIRSWRWGRKVLVKVEPDTTVRGTLERELREGIPLVKIVSDKCTRQCNLSGRDMRNCSCESIVATDWINAVNLTARLCCGGTSDCNTVP